MLPDYMDIQRQREEHSVENNDFHIQCHTLYILHIGQILILTLVNSEAYSSEHQTMPELLEYSLNNDLLKDPLSSISY